MHGLMMDRPLLIQSLIRYAARYHAETEIVSRTTEGPLHRYTYADAEPRAKQLAKALMRLGIGFGDRVATIAWNNHRHFEPYYAISGIGAVCHTINPRLFADQLAYIVNHAQDKVLLVDLTFVPLAEKMAASWPARQALCRDDRPGAYAGDEPPQRALLRGPRRRRDPRARVAGVRREHRVLALLHLRHDRQSQGRAL